MSIISSSHFPVISEAWSATYYVDAANGMARENREVNVFFNVPFLHYTSCAMQKVCRDPTPSSFIISHLSSTPKIKSVNFQQRPSHPATRGFPDKLTTSEFYLIIFR